MTHLYSYKMTHDSGFAPNPYGKTLTLATCKPDIRKGKAKGDWIAGWTANRLLSAPHGFERLVYLMQVAEKLTIEEYFRDPRFQNKIPKKGSMNKEKRQGDNIYYKDDKGNWQQIPNDNHPPGFTMGDVKGEYVLIAEKNSFCYFGKPPLEVPEEYRPIVPKGQARYGYGTHGEKADIFIEFVKQSYSGKIGTPHDWDGGWTDSICKTDKEEDTKPKIPSCGSTC